MPLIDKCVTKGEGDTYDFQCPVNDGTCVPLGQRPFHSDRWPTKALAKKRGEQHFAEHKGEGHMPELKDFLEAEGLTVVANANADGEPVVTAKDL